ncbi:MAG TPA: 3-dehydroquinate synthase [Jiangellaceae bacterium]
MSGHGHDARSLPPGGGHNVVLTGFMGTGKTTVGRLLADDLGFEFVDTDQLIEQRHGPIPDIFAHRGEEGFREIERAIAAELATKTGLVISTGGRMMLDPANVRALSANGRVFCLVATPEEVFERVTNDPSRVERPLLQVPDPRQRIVELMSERDRQYRRFPQLVTDAMTPQDVARDLQAVTSSDPHTYAIENPAGRYDFAVGAGLLPFVRQLTAIEGPMVVITDDEVANLYLPSLGAVDLEIRLSARHGRKSMRSVEHVYDTLLDADIDRSATIVSLGTSVVEDVAGFVAATYLRGVDLVHCPTNLIAMIDTSIGGKVGLDRPHGRNLVGLFKQPTAVIADVATLQTLEPREFAAGMAEVVKHGLIAGSDLLGQVEAGEWTAADNALPGALGRLQTLVAQAIQVKIAIVQEDPFEEGRRAVLNLGHTFAHGIEHVTDGHVNHGEAVGIGLVAAARLSERGGFAKPGLANHVGSLVSHVGLDPHLPGPIPPEKLVEAMRRDKKRRGGRLRFVLLRDIGDVIVTDDVASDDLVAVLDSLNP